MPPVGQNIFGMTGFQNCHGTAVPAIHVLLTVGDMKSWMAGTRHVLGGPSARPEGRP